LSTEAFDERRPFGLARWAATDKDGLNRYCISGIQQLITNEDS
jgi:hypothetical protein